MSHPPLKYVLITAARNEEALIGKTLESVVRQTQLPERWIIVDDGSTDRTAEIIAPYVEKYSWIRLVRNPRRESRDFAAKANAVNDALRQMQDLKFDILGNLDADTSFAPDYMEFLIQKFAADPKLGVAGTPFREDSGYDSSRDSFEGENHVAGACQLFRRECWNDIGGYLANPGGGVDWIAVTTARTKGWTTRSFADKRIHHHRLIGTAGRSQFAALFLYGQKDYYLGGSPVWELFRLIYRTAKRPYFVGSLALGCGYIWAAARRLNRPVSPELMRFHRAEQMRKLRNVLCSVLLLKRVDSFSSGTARNSLNPGTESQTRPT
jgi:glycosyltransferase involved in cell wall biosynthesis